MATLQVQTVPDPTYEYVQTAVNDTGSPGIFDDDTDVEIGVDFAYGIGTPNDPAVDFTLLSKGIINAVPNGYNFTYQLWDVSLGEWSSAAIETFTVGDEPPPPNTPPVLSIPGPLNLVDPDGSGIPQSDPTFQSWLNSATAFDAEDGDLTDQITTNENSLIYPMTEGNTPQTVTWTVIDSGGLSDQRSSQVRVGPPPENTLESAFVQQYNDLDGGYFPPRRYRS